MMKNLHFHIIAIIFIAIFISGCKTTEANYRAAYETAKSGQEKETEEDEMINRELLPQTVVFDEVSLPVRRIYIIAETHQPGLEGKVERFNVAVTSFRQLFNARNMAQRLKSNGFEHSFVAKDREENYYVIAGSANSAKEADALLEKVRGAEIPSMKSPFPYVIRL